MDEAQTDQAPEAPSAPQEERAARHLRLLGRMAEIQMEVAEAVRTEAVEAPQPGVDYCRRVAVIARSLRLTLLLEEKLSRPPEERPETEGPAAKRPAAAPEADRAQRVFLAVAAAIGETAESDAEDARLCREVQEYLERPEVAERVESCPAPEMVAELCRKYGLPADTGEWLAAADATLGELGYTPAEDVVAVPDRAVIRRRLRVITALGAAIRAETEDEEECDRRFAAMAEEMDRPDLREIADGFPAAEAVARLCPTFGLPPEEAERWVEEADEDLAEMDLPPVDGDLPEVADTG
ncbi:hypothetical protein [Inquilinus sp.]|uniref:hypothetical protein n=1 Tax=Inquilinus sp. TaxID=1932117 RepID=UPI0031D10DCD